MKRPRLTAKRIRGVQIVVNNSLGLLWDMEDEPQDAWPPGQAGELRAAMKYLQDLVDWYEETRTRAP